MLLAVRALNSIIPAAVAMKIISNRWTIATVAVEEHRPAPNTRYPNRQKVANINGKTVPTDALDRNWNAHVVKRFVVPIRVVPANVAFPKKHRVRARNFVAKPIRVSPFNANFVRAKNASAYRLRNATSVRVRWWPFAKIIALPNHHDAHRSSNVRNDVVSINVASLNRVSIVAPNIVASITINRYDITCDEIDRYNILKIIKNRSDQKKFD